MTFRGPDVRGTWTHPFLGASAVLFAVSFALPAFGSGDRLLGWQCALLVIAQIGEVLQGRWEELYMVGFALANFLFPTALFLTWKNTNLSRWTPWVASIATVQVLSWGVLEGFQCLREGPMKLGVGYFVWALAYLVGTAAIWAARPRSGIPGNPPASTSHPDDSSLFGCRIDALLQTKWMVSARFSMGWSSVLLRRPCTRVRQPMGIPIRWTGPVDRTEGTRSH